MAYTLGEVVRWERKQLLITQKECAELLGISEQYLCDIEAGRRTPSDEAMIQKLARTLRVHSDWLWFVVGKLPPDIVAHDVEHTDVLEAFHTMRLMLRVGRASG